MNLYFQQPRLKNPEKKVGDTIKTKSNNADTAYALPPLTTLDKNAQSQQQTNIKASVKAS